MSTPYGRDLVGYAGHPPHPRWPGEARIAVNFVVNYWVHVHERPHLVVPGNPFYPLSHSRKNFAAFQAASGKGHLP
jgi:hypothetical protein